MSNTFNEVKMGVSELDVLFQKNREEMTESEERTWVNFCYNAYEFGGFREHFTTPYEQYSQYEGFKFKVLGRCVEGVEYDLCVLPAWKIAILNDDGEQVACFDAYPEEITLIDTKMKIPNPMISRIDFTNKYNKILKEDKTALFDSRDYTQEEIEKMIHIGVFRGGVVVCDVKDFEQVFRSMEPNKYKGE